MAEEGTERREHGLTTEDAIGALDATAEADPIADAICGAGHQVLTKATLSLPLLCWTGERK